MLKRNSNTVSLRHGSGFTLLELLVVLAILGLIASFAAPRVFTTAPSRPDQGAGTLPEATKTGSTCR